MKKQANCGDIFELNFNKMLVVSRTDKEKFTRLSCNTRSNKELNLYLYKPDNTVIKKNYTYGNVMLNQLFSVSKVELGMFNVDLDKENNFIVINSSATIHRFKKDMIFEELFHDFGLLTNFLVYLNKGFKI